MTDGGRMTQTELEERCDYWRRILRLQDWKITVEVKRGRDMELGKRNGGEIVMLSNHRRAWIYLLDPLDIRPETLAENEMEKILVHELLHVLTEPFDLPEEGLVHVAEEQLINCVAEALVALDRRGEGP